MLFVGLRIAHIEVLITDRYDVTPWESPQRQVNGLILLGEPSADGSPSTDILLNKKLKYRYGNLPKYSAQDKIFPLTFLKIFWKNSTTNYK